MSDNPITKSDLQEFRTLLLSEIQKILQNHGQTQGRQWLKSCEVRKMLKISPGTLQNLRVNGTLSFAKIGGTIFYNYDDIESMFESNKVVAFRK